MAIYTGTGTTTGTLSDANSAGRAVPTYKDSDGSITSVESNESREMGNLRRSRDGRTLTRFFYIKGTKDTVEADRLMPRMGAEDSTYPEFTVTDVSIVQHAKGDDEASHYCKATVTYTSAVTDGATIEDPEANNQEAGGGIGGGSATQKQYGFSVSAETYNRQSAIAQTTYTDVGVTDTKNLTINATPDGRVQGVDIDAGIVELREDAYFSESGFSQSYRDTLVELTKTVNNAAFRGYAAGEVLFDTFSAEKSGRKWHVQFTFRVRKNETETFKIYPDWDAAAVSIEAAVKGWEYVWLKYQTRKTDERVESAPTSVSIAQVYKDGDFSKLGIGTEVLP